MMARNQGSTRISSQTRPVSGRVAFSQRAERSTMDSVAHVSTTNITMSGPLIRMPPAIAVHRIAGHRQPTGPSGWRRWLR